MHVLEGCESCKCFFYIRRATGVVTREIEGCSAGDDDGQALVGVFCKLLYTCHSQCVVATEDKSLEGLTGGRESPVRNIGFGLRDEVVWAEVLVRPACDVSETTNKCFMAQNLWLTCFNQVVWTVLRGFVEELDLLEPECEIDLRNARLSNILHACGPVHVFVVVFPCRLSRAVHVGETIRESGIARPGCVRV